MEKQKQQPQRLQSLDALRGFDMLFIMGGASLFVALATLFPNPFFQAIAGQMEHVEWNGLAHHDTIFPLFLFIAGISFLLVDKVWVLLKRLDNFFQFPVFDIPVRRK